MDAAEAPAPGSLAAWLEALALGRFAPALAELGCGAPASLAELTPAEVDARCAAAGMKPIQRKKVAKNLALLGRRGAAAPQPEPEPEPEPEPPPRAVSIVSGFHAQTPFDYLNATIFPQLLRALGALEAARPENALEFLADALDKPDGEAAAETEAASEGDGGIAGEIRAERSGLLGVGLAIGRSSFLQYTDAYLSSALLEVLIGLNRERPPKDEARAAAVRALRAVAAKFSPPETPLHGHISASAAGGEMAAAEPAGPEEAAVDAEEEHAAGPAVWTAASAAADSARLERALASLQTEEQELLPPQPTAAIATAQPPPPPAAAAPTHPSLATKEESVARAHSPQRRPRSPQLVGRETPGALSVAAHLNAVQGAGPELVGPPEEEAKRRKPKGLAVETPPSHGPLQPS